VTGLTARGHGVRAIAPRGAVPAAGSGAVVPPFESRHPRIETTWLRVRVESSALLEGSRDAAYRRAEDAGIRAALPRLIAARRPDVILIGRESVLGEVPPIASRHGIPTVALVQGGLTMRAILARAEDPLARHQAARLRQVDAVVTVAAHLRDALAPLGLRRVSTIPNPVDLERFRPGPKPPALTETLGLGAGTVVVSHVSNFKSAKRVSDVVASAARVLATRADVVYLLVGDGPERIPAEAQCRALGLTGRVRFTGWVDRDDMPDYLRATDVVVMASESEGLPFIYLESQASGRVLVGSDIPATRELIADGRTGLIFRTADVAGLAAQTLRAAGDPALRAAIGGAARVAVHACAQPVVLDAYARLLEEVVRTRHRSGGAVARRDLRASRRP
jgi:glycosyltransferase involved in cell wall biosynthesis